MICRFCGAQAAWAQAKNGKWVTVDPLDHSKPHKCKFHKTPQEEKSELDVFNMRLNRLESQITDTKDRLNKICKFLLEIEENLENNSRAAGVAGPAKNNRPWGNPRRAKERSEIGNKAPFAC